MFSFARLATVFFILGYFGYLGPVRGWSCGELTQATTNPCTGQVQLALALAVVDIELASVAHLFARTFVSVLAATQFVNLGRKLGKTVFESLTELLSVSRLVSITSSQLSNPAFLVWAHLYSRWHHSIAVVPYEPYADH